MVCMNVNNIVKKTVGNTFIYIVYKLQSPDLISGITRFHIKRWTM